MDCHRTLKGTIHRKYKEAREGPNFQWTKSISVLFFYNNSEQLGELAKFKEIQKKQQLIEKYQDGATIQNKYKLYEEDLKKVKNENMTLKNHISESYESQIDQKRRKEIETKRYEREQEQKMINYAKEQLDRKSVV